MPGCYSRAIYCGTGHPILEEQASMGICTEDLWSLLYDQMHEERPAGELEFYIEQLEQCEGPVLELASGTGQVLYRMLEEGFDIYGLDICPDALDILYSKAEAMGVPDIHERVTQQNMVDFHYDNQFGAIIIPCRSFVHLITQEDQIACLKNIYNHLKDGGKLILNFFSPDYNQILSTTQPTNKFSSLGVYKHPRTGESIEMSMNMLSDVVEQFQDVTLRFKCRDGYHTSHLYARWSDKEEFKLLLKLAGFTKWELYGWFDKSEFTNKSGEMVWIVEK